MYRSRNFELLYPNRGYQGSRNRDAVSIVAGIPIPRHVEDADIHDRIEKIWERECQEARKLGKNLFPGSLYRLSKAEMSGARFVLHLGLTNYREFMGTNVEAGKSPVYMEELLERGKEKHDDEDAYFSNALAICSTIVTSDGLIPVGLRSDKVAEYPRCWHTVGGHPEIGGDIFDGMVGEITEELGIATSDILDIELTGLVRNRWTRKPEVTFTTRVKPEYRDIERRRGSERNEHFRFFGVNKKGLLQFINENQRSFTLPPGYITVPELEKELSPEGIPDNTANYFVPSGEACWILYLRENFGIEDLLPHIERVGHKDADN